MSEHAAGSPGAPAARAGAARARSRVVLFALCVAAALLMSGGYVGWTLVRGDGAGAGAGAEAGPVSLNSLGRDPLVVFQHVGRDAGYAKIAIAALDSPRTARTVSSVKCERVYFAAGRGLCLVPDGLFKTYRARIFDRRLRTVDQVALAGIPSRARISSDGRYGATTVFVAGDSYAEGGFSTRTTIIDMRAGDVVAELEDFTAIRDGKRFRRVDFNYWGVTFARDSTRFYATLATGGKTYLVEGDIPSRRVVALRENVECPSLSPDGTRIAFKKLVGRAGQWRLHVLDLATMSEMPLAEARPVDDQVEWLDDDRVLYGLEGAVWTVAADGSGRPSMYLANALSPAVVH